MLPSSGASQLSSPLLSPDIPAQSSTSSHLRPEDAYASFPGNSKSTPPRKIRKSSPLGRSDTITASNNGNESSRSRLREKRRGRDGGSGTSRKRGTWKKLLWVKQAYPDNYTDELQFLSHLQRNPRLRPYEFWPLVADSTIIVQHIASVIIFICCFVGIFQERVSPVSVVSWATIGTVLGWVLRDWWISWEEQQRLEDDLVRAAEQLDETDHANTDIDTADSTLNGTTTPGSDSLGISFSGGTSTRGVSRATSMASLSAATSGLHSRNSSITSEPRLQTHNHTLSPIKDDYIPCTASPMTLVTGHPNGASTFATYSHYPPYEGRISRFSPRNQERLATAKSAILIYCALLGLSPILKSLTKSTSPDSIWAMSSWLIVINVFTFDYGAGVEAKYPAPLATNAALMASTVLASRLPSTTHVFSLTLFSIEVFGLFPVFRRHLRHVSYPGHLVLTGFLTVGAGAGLCMTITGGGWTAAVVGVVLGGV
ncbi:phosphatidylinositol N-acetylglucosaminyltransferase-like protein [Elsinoe australis]|uniref:Phosphatidylinositol N-acetylglucosaminyltransferase-like protein n=1 Tax=Elsinoe australis TaxID=40998 RepID=A0A4U7AQ14_9PEZI|nr:phosphatidylinositol N-acetylglucosaminyltransferase-like protein [Elsinoe australis]